MNSYLAIALGALVPMVLGFVWYHPKVFGGAWMKSLGLTEADLQRGNMAVIFGVAFLCALFLAWNINAYAGHQEPGMSQFVHGFYHGAYHVGVPAAVVLISNGLFQRNTPTNVIINALYWIVALGLVGSLLYSVAAPDAPAAG